MLAVAGTPGTATAPTSSSVMYSSGSRPSDSCCTWEIGADWKTDSRAAFASEVEVRFLAEDAGRTRVELEHRNFERMGPPGESMRKDVDGGWPALLERYAQEMSRGESQA